MTLSSLTLIAPKISRGRELDLSVHTQCVHFVLAHKKNTCLKTSWITEDRGTSCHPVSFPRCTQQWRCWQIQTSHFVLHTKVDPKNIGCIYMFISERGFIFVKIQMSPNLFISWVGKLWAITTQNYDLQQHPKANYAHFEGKLPEFLQLKTADLAKSRTIKT